MSPELLSEVSAWYPPAAAAALGITRWVGVVLKSRRLRKFGDAAVLGAAGGGPRTLLSIVLFAVGGWALGAMLVPVEIDPAAASPARVVFCVDPDALGPEIQSLRTRDTRALQLLYAISAVGNGLDGAPVGALVPTATGARYVGASQDFEGVAMKVRSLWPETSVQGTAPERKADLWLLGRPDVSRSAQALCLLTFKDPAAFPETESPRPGGPRRWVVRLGDDLGSRSYFAASTTGAWVELPDLRSFCTAVRSGAAAPARANAAAEPGFPAALAFAALSGEWLLGLAHRRRNEEVTARKVVGALCLGSFLAAPPTLPATGGRHVSEISPGVALISDISEEQPRLGEQFAIVYYLRLSIPVRAVDIDPQSFTGLWTQPVAAPGQSASGRAGPSEFLLRQVVAWPLSVGPVQLPPLRVRIQTAHSAAWDLFGASEPVTITSRSVPPGEGGTSSFPLVGSLAGRIEQREGSSQEWVLELEGSALVASLDPANWLAEAAGKPVVASPVEIDDTARQIVDNGRRSVFVLQRRRWLVAGVDGGRIDFDRPLALGVFQTTRARWEHASIRVVARTEGHRSEPGNSSFREGRVGRGGRGWPVSRHSFLAACALLAALTAAVLVLFRRRQVRRASAGRGC